MNLKPLLDAIVSQTTVLIAQIATTGGIRAPLGEVSDQVFISLSKQLEELGLGRKVAADMFGMAVRSYQRKMQRLTCSQSEEGESLWSALYAYAQRQQKFRLQDVLAAFPRDDECLVRGILNDQVESQLLTRSGRNRSVTYRITPDREEERGEEASKAMAWQAIYRHGPTSDENLQKMLSIPTDQLAEAVDALVKDGTVQRGEQGYEARHCVIPLGSDEGWEASVIDHFQAVACTIAAKLRTLRSDSPPAIGGSTFSFDIYPGHPYEAQVQALLTDARDRLQTLWEEVRAHNEATPLPDHHQKHTHYVGHYYVSSENTE